MARGKYLSLEEACNAGKLKQLAEEHPSEGSERVFDALFGRMTKRHQKTSKHRLRTPHVEAVFASLPVYASSISTWPHRTSSPSILSM